MSLTSLFGNTRNKLWYKILHFYNVLALISFHTFRRHLLNSALFRSGFLLGLGDTKAIATRFLPLESLRTQQWRQTCIQSQDSVMPAIVEGLCLKKVEKVTGGIEVGPWKVMKNFPGRERHRSGKGQAKGRTLAQCAVRNQPAGPGVRKMEWWGPWRTRSHPAVFKKKSELEK